MRTFIKLATAFTLGAFTLAVSAQTDSSTYPNKPIKLVVPYPPGSGTDTIARYAAKRLEASINQSVVVENRTGGNAIIAVQAVTNASPDGYTLLWAANAPVTTNVALYNKLPYDPTHDLSAVARIAYSPMGLLVPANSPYKTAKELLDATQAKPMTLNYASGSATYNIATEWLLSIAGGKANLISYKGAAPAMIDLAGGQVDFTIVELSAALPLVKSGKVRLLAVTSDKRMPSEPNTPSLQELGYKDFFQVAWWGVFGPKSLPEPIRSKLEKNLLTNMADTEAQAYLRQNNFSEFLSNGQVLREFQIKEITRETKLVNEFKIPKM